MKHIKNEVLSAYANNEINDSQKHYIEEHLLSCTKCQKTLDIYLNVKHQLMSETVSYAGVEIKNLVMSSIRETAAGKNRPRRWLRPALVAVPVVAAVVITLSLVFTGSPLTPEHVLAKSDMALKEVTSRTITTQSAILNEATNV